MRWSELAPRSDCQEFLRVKIIAEKESTYTGQTVNAEVLRYVGGSEMFAPSDPPFEILAVALDGTSPVEGTRCWVIWKDESKKWEIIGGASSSNLKQMVIGEITTSALATSDADCTFDINLQVGHGTAHTTTSGLTANNVETHTAGTYIFYGDVGDTIICMYDEASEEFTIFQVECP